MARTTICTPGKRKAIIEGIKNGLYPSTAAQRVGIDPSTISKWLSKGEEGIEPYVTLINEIKKADSEAEYNLVSDTYKKALESKSVIEKVTVLSRRWRNRWAENAQLEDAAVDAMRGLAALLEAQKEGLDLLTSERRSLANERDTSHNNRCPNQDVAIQQVSQLKQLTGGNNESI